MLEQEYFTEKSYKLIDLSLTSTNGRETNVYGQLVELSLFEDIYNSTISGKITISDALDLFAKLPITGFEFIVIKLGKPGSLATEIVQKTYRIYKMESNEISLSSNAAHVYTLYFCAEENILSQSMKISKSYKGKRISTIVDEILSKNLMIPKSKIFVEPSYGVHDIVIPYMHPLAAIYWLSGRTLSSTPRPDYLFFEKMNPASQTFNFLSLDTLFKGSTKASYSYDVKNIDSKTDTTLNEIQDVIKYDFISIFNILNGISNGMYSGLLKTVDLARLKFDDTRFSYKKYFDDTQHLEKNAGTFQNEYNDRRGKTIYENHQANVRMFPTTKDHDTAPSIASKEPGIKPNFVERWMIQRTSQLNQLNYFKLRLVIPGDIYIGVGDVIEFSVPLLTSKLLTDENKNAFHSGRYLITAIRHKIDLQSYEMIVEAVRDCITGAYPSSTTQDLSI